MRRYFKLQIRNGETGENFVDEALSDNRITSHIDYAKEIFLTLNSGDIILIHKGNAAHCLVEVKK